MLLIEALKERKRQLRKAEDLRGKLKEYCADVEIQEPVYGTEQDQRNKIQEWIQGHRDSIRNVADLTMAISRTNLETEMSVRIGEKTVTMPVAYWVIRRTEKLAELEIGAFSNLSDKGMPEKGGLKVNTPSGSDTIIVKRRLYFDPASRDREIELLQEEISRIDSGLEIVNATTEVKGLPERWS